MTWISRVDARRRQEGALVDSTARLLADYTRNNADEHKPDGVGGAAEQFPWPKSDTRAAGLFLIFDPPLVQYPRRLGGQEVLTFDGRVQIFGGATGKRWYDGAVRRTIIHEGNETLNIGDRVYADCVRLRIATRVHIPWAARVNFTEHIWLAVGVGEVKRIQQLSGRWLLFGFEDVWAYELQAVQPAEPFVPQPKFEARGVPHGVRASGQPLETWHSLAIYLQPVFPIPTLAGAVIETGEPTQRATTSIENSDSSMATSTPGASSTAETPTAPAATR